LYLLTTYSEDADTRLAIFWCFVAILWITTGFPCHVMLEEVRMRLDGFNKAQVLIATGLLILVVAVSDWYVGNTLSLGVLYILPMLLGGLVMRPGQIIALAALCALLRSFFDVPSRHLEAALRFVFSALAYLGSGLFVIVLARNRELAIEHLRKVQKEQGLRREAEEQLQVLVDSSPAAVLTLDRNGVVLAANRAAANLFGIPDGQSVLGRVIASYLPLLSDALALGGREDFRTAAQCYGRREDGDIFLAHTWFSTYTGHEGTRLAAIVVDSSEEMRDREENNLRQLMRNNRIAAAAVSHEVRNLCGSIAMLTTNLGDKYGLGVDQDYGGLVQLVKGLEHIAQLGLHSKAETVEDVSLRAVLDNLRIVIEPGWREADCTLQWVLPSGLPRVVADSQGLLQAFLNLAQNSLRAVQRMPVRELKISAVENESVVNVRFEDSGPGISDPERLFKPFQPGAEGTGLGLYITRAIVRSYGGELRFERRESGSCFVVELQLADVEGV
jgi:two-component system sensor kinase FixL